MQACDDIKALFNWQSHWQDHDKGSGDRGRCDRALISSVHLDSDPVNDRDDQSVMALVYPDGRVTQIQLKAS